MLQSLNRVHTLYFMGTSIMMAIIAFLLKLYFDKKEDIQGQVPSQQNFVILDEVLATTEASFISKENVLGITDETHPLLIRLRNEAPKLYKHSMESAKLSKGAARIIGANKELAYAGSLYHEIGRLEGNDYIKLGLYLLDLYHIPQEIQEVVKQHSYKIDGPKTREAAVVMLTDNILTTMEYLRESEKTNISYDKIIEDIIFIRLKNKTLDDSGLSIQDFNKLREFYVSQFRGQV